MSETPIELFEYLTETGQNPFCGGDKTTQSRDIVQAQAYWSEYLRRLQ